MFKYIESLKNALASFKRQLAHIRKSKVPSFPQWAQLPRILSEKERSVLILLVTVFVVSTFTVGHGGYTAFTRVAPDHGGSIIEGVVGHPRLINPVYAAANDVDRDLEQLIYSGLLRYNNEGTLIPDLAHDFTIAEGGRVFEFNLREDVVWHDKKPFTADDVVFTIETIQDPRYKSPVRANWVGVGVEKISDFKLRLRLKEPYAPFLERLTLKILPSHIWKEIGSENFALSTSNIQAIGTGPYKIADITQERTGAISRIELKRNKNYHLDAPYISSVIFRFFNSEEELVGEAKRGNIQTFSVSSVKDINSLGNSSLASYSFSLPRYFAVFFNTEAETVDKVRIREALSLAIDKGKIVSLLSDTYAKPIDSPFRPDLFDIEQAPVHKTDTETALSLFKASGFQKIDGNIGTPQSVTGKFTAILQQGSTGTVVQQLQECLARDSEVYPEGTISNTFGPLTKKAVIRFQDKYAADILAPISLTKGTGKVGPLTNEKLNAVCDPNSDSGNFIPFTVSLVTLDQSPLKEVSQMIRDQWTEFGIQVELRTFSATDLERDIIKPREYEALLFGEILTKIPDPFPFWHSSQKRDPGLNLSLYSNKNVDTLLEQARKESDKSKRAASYGEIQTILLGDVPAIFLYDIDYVYFAPKELRGIQPRILSDPSERLSGMGSWYTKTKRAFK